MRREQEEDRGQARQGSARADRGAVQVAVQAGVRRPEEPGPRVPHPLDVARRRGGRPERQGHRQGRPEEARRGQEEPGQRAAVPEVPGRRGPHGGRRLLPAAQRAARAEDHREDHQGHGQGLGRPGRAVLREEQVALRPARAPRPAHRADQDQGPGRRRQGRARRRPVVEGRDEGVLDRPGLEGQRREAAGRGQGSAGEGARRGRLQGLAQQADRTRSRRSSATTSSRSRRSSRASSSRCASPRPRSSRSSPRRTSARRWRASARSTAIAGRAARSAARAS